jgi:hypothetical protein
VVKTEEYHGVVVSPKAKNNTQGTRYQTNSEPDTNSTKDNKETRPVNITEFLAQATPEDNALIQNAQAALSREEQAMKDKRDAAKAGFKANSALTFTDAQLDATPTDVLEQLAALKPVANTAAPAPVLPGANTAACAITPMPRPTLK